MQTFVLVDGAVVLRALMHLMEPVLQLEKCHGKWPTERAIHLKPRSHGERALAQVTRVPAAYW